MPEETPNNAQETKVPQDMTDATVPELPDAPAVQGLPTTKPTGKTPMWGGSTGGLLASAYQEEKYLITWNSPTEQVFEMPTGGAATMNQGDNLLYLAKKEQAMALGRHLRSYKISNYKIWREFPNGDQVYLHPNDGVFPEKVNPGRVAVGSISRKIGDNPDPIKVKFTGKATYEV